MLATRSHARLATVFAVALASLLVTGTARSQEPPAGGGPAPAAGDPVAPADGNPPPGLRLRKLEQKVQSLKEQAWRVKARVGMLKEAVLGGGVGARASIRHQNKMGGSFKMIK